MSDWSVVVGNVGTTLVTQSEMEARKEFNAWRRLSIATQGRASGEDVMLFRDGDLVKEYIGRLSRSGRE